MNEIVVDAAVWARLLAGGAIRVRSEGQVQSLIMQPDGFEHPALPPDYVLDEPWPSDEELDRRVREEKSYTTEEVLAKMKEWRNGR